MRVSQQVLVYKSIAMLHDNLDFFAQYVSLMQELDHLYYLPLSAFADEKVRTKSSGCANEASIKVCASAVAVAAL
jgi:uncharacterized protein YfeS